MATWLTTPLESDESGKLIMGTVRKDVDKFRSTGKFKYRVVAIWSYEAADKGMPSESDAEMMEKFQETVEQVFAKDPVAVLTGVFTGEGARDFEFYTLSLHIFQRKFNEALADFPMLPLSFVAEEDEEWSQYAGALALAEKDDESEE